MQLNGSDNTVACLFYNMQLMDKIFNSYCEKGDHLKYLEF